MEGPRRTAGDCGTVSVAGHVWLAPPAHPVHLCLAKAVGGDAAALRALLTDLDALHVFTMHRIGPALYAAAHRLGLTGEIVEHCHGAFVGEAGRWLFFREGLARVGAALEGAGVSWMPFKGIDTAERFFPRPELRPMSDIDVLVPSAMLGDAVRALEGDGWTFPATPLLERYQREEGYNWSPRSAHGGNLELHYRLWGSVPESLTEACWKTAVADPEFGEHAFRLAPEMAFVVSAVHSWKRGNQIRMLDLWELKLIADRLENAEGVVAAAREHGLQLAVGLVADYAGQLWDHPVCEEVGRSLLSQLRLAERMALRRVRRRGIDAMTLERLTFTRLLARRPSRLGWKLVLRRVWPHPGDVEQTTPGELPWWRRRAMAAWAGIGMRGKSTQRRRGAEPPPTAEEDRTRRRKDAEAQSPRPPEEGN